MEKEENKITLGLIVGWILGIFAAIAGVSMLFTEPVPGALFILLAIVVLPPANKMMRDKFNFSLSGGLKFVLAIVILGLAGSSITSDAVSQSSSVSSNSDSEQSEQAEEPQQQAVEIIDVSTKVTEQNSVWWKYAWVLTLKNNTDRDRTVTAELKWVDADGFVIDSDTEYSLTIPAGEEKTFNDFALVSTPGASDVDSIQAEISGF